MEESRKIKLPLGKVSWEKELGSYYIDMRPVIIHYTNNIYNGKFDNLFTLIILLCSFLKRIG